MRNADNLPPSSVVTKFGDYNLMEPSGKSMPVTECFTSNNTLPSMPYQKQHNSCVILNISLSVTPTTHPTHSFPPHYHHFKVRHKCHTTYSLSYPHSHHFTVSHTCHTPRSLSSPPILNISQTVTSPTSPSHLITPHCHH